MADQARVDRVRLAVIKMRTQRLERETKEEEERLEREKKEEAARLEREKKEEEKRKIFKEMLAIGVPRWLEEDKLLREKRRFYADGGVGDWEDELARRKRQKEEARQKNHKDVLQHMVQWRLENLDIEQ